MHEAKHNQNCSTCLNHRNTLQRETMIAHDIPDSPWIKVGIDLFSLYRKDYIAVVDYNSKYIEVAHIKDESARSVIDNIKKIFSRHGIPKDNGPQFTSHEFKEFATTWDFVHRTSSPEYPKSNGLVERHIQTIKRTLKKSNESNQDAYLALLALNSTPDERGMSPASILFGRHPRTTVPSVIPSTPNCVQSKERTKTRYDTKSKDLPPISPNTTVRIYSKSKSGNWKQKGNVISKRTEPRSYNILNEKGNIIRRNRWQLLPSNETCDDEISVYDDKISDDPIEQSNVTPEINSTDNANYRTRSGRIIRQPDRYGYE